jgi:hypothetical protein
VRLAQAALRAHGLPNSPGLNAQNYGGFDGWDGPVVFEYDPVRQMLTVLALCYRFRKPPRPGVIAGFQEEERRGTDTGGGAVEFRSDSGGLFLTRSYRHKTDPRRFVEETDELMRAARYWADEVLPNVADRVFGHDH